MTEHTPLWSDERIAAYELGMQTEREHQNALSRLVMEKHEAELAKLRARIVELEQLWPDMPELDGIDRFEQYPITGDEKGSQP